jgi:hypothetical protein
MIMLAFCIYIYSLRSVLLAAFVYLFCSYLLDTFKFQYNIYKCFVNNALKYLLQREIDEMK